MPNKLGDLKLSFRIANIEDDTYPFTDGRAANNGSTTGDLSGGDARANGRSNRPRNKRGRRSGRR